MVGLQNEREYNIKKNMLQWYYPLVPTHLNEGQLMSLSMASPMVIGVMFSRKSSAIVSVQICKSIALVVFGRTQFCLSRIL
jgi:hypothetical protein